MDASDGGAGFGVAHVVGRTGELPRSGVGTIREGTGNAMAASGKNQMASVDV
jgi:hypothetical protein